MNLHINRRKFLATGAVFIAGTLLLKRSAQASLINIPVHTNAPSGLIPKHFPSSLHAFVWRNWTLVPLERIASTVQASPKQIQELASWMGLPKAQTVSPDQWSRSYLTVIRRNWHLLPREQLLKLLDWTDETLEFTLIEDDFFYIKLGSLKPECPEITWRALEKVDPLALSTFKEDIKRLFPKGVPALKEPYFHFVKELSSKPETAGYDYGDLAFSPRIAYPYFALFGDPLMSDSSASYPDEYLDRMQQSGVDSIWMHIVLSKLTPFPWDTEVSKNWEKRLENLEKLSLRAFRKGIKIYLYLNEPRNQTAAFFEKYPHLKGAGHALCTSVTEVQNYLEDSLAMISEKVPLLGGFFSITASENPTHCWSHNQGKDCPRCRAIGAAKVISSLNNTYLKGIQKGFEQGKKVFSESQKAQVPKLIVWDWGWADGFPESVLPDLIPGNRAFMSVSEWDLPIERGGISSRVGEYSISSIGPGPRATKHWGIARQLGIPCIAKIQANNSWEIGAVPYIPALFNVGEHIENLRKADVSGLMLGWSLGGYPSPNLEMILQLGYHKDMSKEDAMLRVALRRFGGLHQAIIQYWKEFSQAFSQFPYNISVVYQAPLQAGPSNLLWEKPTGYTATMVGLPYDDLKSWRAIYPEEVFIGQLTKVYTQIQAALAKLNLAAKSIKLRKEEKDYYQKEIQVAETIALHYQSIVNQSRFIQIRNTHQGMESLSPPEKEQMIQILQQEMNVTSRLASIQSQDSRIGFEASNHYFYVPQDLYEKLLNCQYLLHKVQA